MYHKKFVKIDCPENIINKLHLPDNIEYKNITFFYKKKPYNKCYKDDLRNKINSKEEKRYEGNMILNDCLQNIKKEFPSSIYYLENQSNSSFINLNDEDLLNIKYLPD